MAKQNKEQMNKEKAKAQKLEKTIFLVGFILITVCILGFAFVSTCRPFRCTKVEDLKEVTYEDYKSKKGEYYVFIYNEDSNREGWYEDIVVEYANYARTHSDALKIYGLNYNDGLNSKIATDLGVSTSVDTSIPGLIKIKDGSISTKYLTWTKLSNELTQAMGK